MTELNIDFGQPIKYGRYIKSNNQGYYIYELTDNDYIIAPYGGTITEVKNDIPQKGEIKIKYRINNKDYYSIIKDIPKISTSVRPNYTVKKGDTLGTGSNSQIQYKIVDSNDELVYVVSSNSKQGNQSNYNKQQNVEFSKVATKGVWGDLFNQKSYKRNDDYTKIFKNKYYNKNNEYSNMFNGNNLNEEINRIKELLK